ncbi:MAG: dockerin type I repeat-containing protein [Oscillospiraceae bacterium]|nr:dockerin type I repeat-containing protein [Oscillospiraceae bacterium]
MMKKFRNLICLTALLFSFQTGISVSAEETDTQEMSEKVVLETVIRAGDITLDTNIDILDVILLNRAILGKEKLSDLQNTIADVNQDGTVNASDSLVIMKMIVGLV